MDKKQKKVKKIVSKADRKQQHKYQLIVAGICLIILTCVTLFVFLIYLL